MNARRPFAWIRSGSVALLALLVTAPPAPAVSASTARQLGDSIADAVERVMPSVVVIRTEGRRYRLARDWFRGDVFGIPERLAGQGSGVIISRDGYILTNHHVIEDAQQIEVALDDGTQYVADLVGQDPHTDLAVLKIRNARDRAFVAVEPGDSDALRVGEFVVAIGSPFSLSSSVTLGIVSQKGRALGALPYEDFIQSDAAVNPGNSGGPLVDIDGRMVGINTMITSSPNSPGSIGISFAVPANVAMHVAESLMRTGKWERPWLGLSMDQTPAGVTVEDVVRDSPAARAGVAGGDRIVSVDGQPVKSGREVQRAVLRHDVGQSVTVELDRAGQPIVLKIPTEAMPPPEPYSGE